MFIKKKMRALLLGILTASFSLPVFAVQVDILILYDDFTANRYGGNAPRATMESWIANTNDAYERSGIDIQLNLAGLELFNPVATGISARLGEIRTSREVANLRDRFGADYVSLVATRDGSICGIANLAVSASRAFSVSGVQCGFLTFAHELGHNMGLGHSRIQGSRGARFPYALGHGVDDAFSTIMVTRGNFGRANRINSFSNPDRTCNGGFPCGVEIGRAEEADARSAINNVRFEIANFRDSVNGGNPTPAPTPPTPVDVPAPSNLVASVNEQSITLVWRDNSTGEDFFEIQRSTSPNSGFSRITTVPRGSTSFTDPNLSENQTYYYRVLASVDGVNSPFSNIASATTIGDVPAPSNLNASPATIDSVNLTWSDNSTGEDFFAIERSTNANSGFAQIGTVGRGNTSFLDQNLSPDTYFYRVRASVDNVLSPFSATSNVTLTGVTEPSIPTADGTGLNLRNLGFSIYTNQTGSDARGFITADGQSIALMNNLWAASATTFEITPSTVLSFDYSTDLSGEIHGIGFEEDDRPSQDRIFNVGGTQNYGIADFQYTSRGATQHFDIPVGQFYTNPGNMRLVVVNDNDAGTGNSGFFSNIRISNNGQDVQADEAVNVQFGLEYIDDNTAILFHNASNQANIENELCIGSDCATGTWNNGRLERLVNVNLGIDYLISFRIQEDNGQCATSSIVTFDVGLNGQAVSSCMK